MRRLMVNSGQGNGSHRETHAESAIPMDQSGVRDLVGYRSYLPDNVRGACSLGVGPQHLNRIGMLHGGIVSMLLDNCCGIAVRNSVGDIDAAVVTVSMAVNFIDSANEGLVTATGYVTGGGRSMKFAEGELRDASGRLLATCNATFKVFIKR
ncbi:PaaI family thioesterase [Paracoccus albus]|uniref:PaaI family thioesterase n=1 Tax=Paracoccus albus TaxID=3017784 RepID=UPI0022F0BA49|nr:PaaI family thioesterase [Paracoccus albus]WBU59224.1 PaaI family thioesterase [Paracoccus albus]